MKKFNYIKLYFEKRMLRIFLLGIMSGFPWVLIGSALTLWLKENDLSRSSIGWAGLIFGVYAINFLWAPLIDRLHIPFLSKKIGHRKSWIIMMQLIIFIALIVWSFLDPGKNLWLVIAAGLGIAISSATQDITIDALRIEQIGKNEGRSMAAGAAISVVGWWTGYKIGGVISLISAEFFQRQGVENYWQSSFLLLTLIIFLCSLGLLFVPEKSSKERVINQITADQKMINRLGSDSNLNRMLAWLSGTIVEPIKSFFKKNKAGQVIGILSNAIGSQDKLPTTGMGAYIVAKSAMQSLLFVCTAEYPWLNISTVSPSFTDTKMLEVFDDRYIELVAKQNTILHPDDVAKNILKLIKT